MAEKNWKINDSIPIGLSVEFDSTTQIQAPLEAITSMSATVVVTTSLVLTMPMPQLQMTGWTETCDLRLTMPVPSLSMHGLTGAIGKLRLTMPMPTLRMEQGGNLVLTMPIPLLQMTGLTGALGSLSLRRLLGSIQMAGHLNEYGVLILTLHPPALQMTGKESEIGNLILSLKPPKLSMHGFAGVVGSLSLRMKAPSLLMSGFIEARGNLALTMPVPFLTMTGDQSMAQFFKGLAMNLSHYSVTDYIGYDFNSLAYFNGKFLAGGKDGIFALGGKNDNGSPINARVKIPALDAYQDILKKARDAWLTTRTDGQMMLVVQLGEDEYYDDLFTETGKALEYRGKLPKGIKERFLAFEVRNVDGSDFDLNNLRITADAVTRRKR